MAVLVTGNDDVGLADQSITAGWVAPGVWTSRENFTVPVRSTAHGYDDGDSMLVEIISSATGYAYVGSAAVFDVAGGENLTFSVRARARDAALFGRCLIQFFDASYAFTETVESTLVLVPVGTYASLFVTVVAPVSVAGSGQPAAAMALYPLYFGQEDNGGTGSIVAGLGFHTDYHVKRASATIPTLATAASRTLSPAALVLTARDAARSEGAHVRALDPAGLTLTPRTPTATPGSVTVFTPAALSLTPTTLGTTGGVPVPPPAPALGVSRRLVTVDDYLDGRVPLYTATIEWWVVSHDLRPLFTINPDRTSPAAIRVDTGGLIRRTLSGLRITPYDETRIDVDGHRLFPWWRLPVGDPIPLGVYLFSGIDRWRHTFGLDADLGLYDQTPLFLGSRGQAFGGPPGASVRGLAMQIINESPLPSALAVIDESTAVVGPDGLAWAADTPRWTILEDLFRLAGFYPPYFTRGGSLRGQAIPSAFTLAGAQHVYGDGAWSRQFRGTMRETTNMTEAYDRWLAVGTDANGAEIVGFYDVPDDAPHSARSKGYTNVAPTIRVPGATTPDQLRQIAHHQAHVDFESYLSARWESWPDPRHGMFETVNYRGEVWREVAHEMVLAPEGPHTHEARKVWA